MATAPIQKEQVPTTEITLPTNGELYPADHALASGKVKLRYLYGRDEDLFVNSKDQNVISKLIQTVVVEPKPFDYKDLILRDYIYLVLASRIMNIGETFAVKDLICPVCGHKHEHVDMNIKDTHDKPVELTPDAPNTNRYTITLPVSKKTISVRAFTMGDQEEVAESLKNSPFGRQKMISYSTAYGIATLPDNDNPKIGEKHSFVEDLVMMDTTTIRNTYDKINGTMNSRIDTQCQVCESNIPYIIPFDTSFFFPTY